MAVLGRMANLEHQIEVGQGDTVILASSLIPGNENAVYRVIDGLTKLGANVVHKGNAKVHVSGHACGGRAPLLLQHPAPRTCCRCTANTATWSSNADAGDRDRRARREHDHRPGRHRRRLKDGVVTWPASSTSATSSSTGPPSANHRDDLKDRRILGEEGFISIFAVVDSRGEARRPGDPGPRLHRGRGRLRRGEPQSSRPWPRRRGTARDVHALQPAGPRTVGRWVNDALPPPPDDRPGGRRGPPAARAVALPCPTCAAGQRCS